MAEGSKSKAKRFIVFAILAVAVALIVLPVATAVSQYTTDAQAHTSVLQTDSIPILAQGTNSTGTYKLTISTTAVNLTAGTGGVTTVTNDYSYTYKNATGVSETGYKNYNPDYIVYNITVGQMNTYAVNKLNLTTDFTENVTAYFGVGTSASNFQALTDVVASGNASKDIVLPISPAMLTGNQSYHAMVELLFTNATDAPATYTLHLSASGVKGGVSTYLAGEDSGYILGGTLLFIFGFFAMPWHDVTIRRVKDAMPRKKGGRKN